MWNNQEMRLLARDELVALFFLILFLESWRVCWLVSSEIVSVWGCGMGRWFYAVV